MAEREKHVELADHDSLPLVGCDSCIICIEPPVKWSFMSHDSPIVFVLSDSYQPIRVKHRHESIRLLKARHGQDFLKPFCGRRQLQRVLSVPAASAARETPASSGKKSRRLEELKRGEGWRRVGWTRTQHINPNQPKASHIPNQATRISNNAHQAQESSKNKIQRTPPALTAPTAASSPACS